MRARHASLLFVAILASSVSAQIGIGRIKTDNLPGDAVLPPGAVNITEIALAGFGNDGSGLDDIRGVARLPNGHYIVSQGPLGSILNQYFELDANGDWVGAIQQPFNIGNEWGLVDLAWDGETGANSRLWAGRAKGIMSFDWQAQAFDPTILPGSANGLHVLDNYVGWDVIGAAIAEIGSSKVFISAAMVGSYWIPGAGWGHSDINYHVMGLPLPGFPRLKPATQFAAAPLGVADTGKFGAAYDPIRGTIWWEIDSHVNNPNPNRSEVRFLEMDVDGNLTGQVVQGISEIGGIAGGCEMYIDAEGNRVMVYVVSMGANPLGITVDQDIMVEMYMGFQYGSSCGGDISFETEPYIGNLGWTVNLENAPANPLGAVFLFRGRPTSPGMTLPGLINCGLLLDIGSLITEGGALPLVNGEASRIRPLPNDLSLVGAEPAFQWLLPSNLNVLPLNLSDAGAVRIGANF